MREKRAKPRYERLAEISRLAFSASYDAGERRWLTATEIANAIKLRNTAHLRGMLSELVESGQLVMVYVEMPGICGKCGLYSAGKLIELETPFARTIQINSKSSKERVKVNG